MKLAIGFADLRPGGHLLGMGVYRGKGKTGGRDRAHREMAPGGYSSSSSYPAAGGYGLN